MKYAFTTSGGDDLKTMEFELRNTLPVDIMVGEGMPYSMFGGVKSFLGMGSKDRGKWV